MRVSRFRAVAGVAVFALCVGAVSTPAAAGGAQPAVAAIDFSDVDATNPFAADIAWLAEQGITTGYADGTFRPLGSVNRDAMAAFLYRLQVGPDAPAACAAGPFTDVTVAHPFCPQIDWLVGEGITTGYPDGTYRPASPVSREAMAAFLYRVAHDGAKAPACGAAPFSDVPASALFCGEITWLAEQEVTTGWADGTFRPGALIERQAMAAFLHRFAVLTPPEPLAVSIDEPVEGATVTGTITVRGSWAPADDDLVSMELLVDGDVAATADAPPFTVTWDTTTVVNGEHTLALRASAAGGRTGTSEPVTVTVDHGPTPMQLLQDDRDEGVISVEDFTRYAIFRWFDPELVPDRYRVPDGTEPGDLTVPLVEILYGDETLDPAVRQEIIDHLTPEGPPGLSDDPLTPEQIEAALAPFEVPDDEALSPTLQATVEEGFIECETSAGWNPIELPDLIREFTFQCVYETDIAAYLWSPTYDDPTTPGVDRPALIDDRTDVLDERLRDISYAGGGRNGIPDYLDALHAGMSDAYRTYIHLGFDPLDRPLIIKIGDFPNVSWPWGVIELHYPEPPKHNPVYLARHEIFHQFQYPYLGDTQLIPEFAAIGTTTNGWWLEASAEWASHKAAESQGISIRTRTPFYEEAGECWAWSVGRTSSVTVPCYATNLPDHLGAPQRPLADFVPQADEVTWLVDDERQGDGPQYGSFLFAEWLEELTGDEATQSSNPDVVLQTWQAIEAEGGRAIDRIGGVLSSRYGLTLADAVRGYHRANYSISESYWDPDKSYWVTLLQEDVPGHVSLPVVTNRAVSDDLEVFPGGVAYFEIDLGVIPNGAVAHITVDIGANADDDLYFDIAPAGATGTPCDTDAGHGTPVDPGRHSFTYLLMAGCSRVAVAVSDTAPGDFGIDVFNATDPVLVTMEMTFEQINTVGFWAARPELGTSFHATAAVGDMAGTLLLDDDRLAGYDIGCTWAACRSTWEWWETQAVGLARPASSDSTLYLDSQGRVYRNSGHPDAHMSGELIMEDVARLVTDYRDVARYAVLTDGTMVQFAAGYPEVSGAVDVDRAAAREWMDRYGVIHTGGYAVTVDGTLLAITDTTAQPVPDVLPVRDVATNTWGDAFVIHTDGTVSMLAKDSPTVAWPAEGITDARTMYVPESAGGTVVLTGDDNHMYFVDCGTDCTQAVVVDSGVTEVDDVAVGYSSAPAWVVADGQFLRPYVEWGATTGEIRFEPGTAAAIAVEDGGCRYALRPNGTILSTGCYDVPSTVPGIVGATNMFCTGEGQCFATFD